LAADIHRIVATDCGSTTTKAILIEKTASGEYRLMARGEAPTTVEKPFEDVTVGVLNAVRELEEITEASLGAKRTLLKDGKVWRFRGSAPFSILHKIQVLKRLMRCSCAEPWSPANALCLSGHS
jgi:hypothetical protein